MLMLLEHVAVAVTGKFCWSPIAVVKVFCSSLLLECAAVVGRQTQLPVTMDVAMDVNT